jgi:D-aspartate ligase
LKKSRIFDMSLMHQHSKVVSKDASVPVVVLKTFNHHGIGIARSLGRLGVDVYGIGISRMVAGLHSRYFKQKFVRDVDTAPSEETVDYLLDIGKRIGKRSLLIPTTDTCTIFLADYADRLKEWYIFPNNSRELTHSLIDKKGMYFLAKKSNVPTPETCFPRSRMDVEKYVKDAMFPVMFKGIDGLAAALRSGRKMFVAKTKRELLDLYDRYEDPSNPNFMLQDYIPGDAGSVWMCNGYFDESSECLFAATGKKIRQYPAYTGATCLGICLKNDTVLEVTKQFLKRIGYKGIVDIGYRYDKRDGKYKVLDVNPRCGSTFRLFVGNTGIDMVRAQYLDLTGQKVPESSMVEGRKWLVEDWDLISCYRYFRDGNLTVAQWAKSFGGVKENGWFAMDDLLPFFLMCARLGLNTVRSRMRQTHAGS